MAPGPSRPGRRSGRLEGVRRAEEVGAGTRKAHRRPKQKRAGTHSGDPHASDLIQQQRFSLPGEVHTTRTSSSRMSRSPPQRCPTSSGSSLRPPGRTPRRDRGTTSSRASGIAGHRLRRGRAAVNSEFLELRSLPGRNDTSSPRPSASNGLGCRCCSSRATPEKPAPSRSGRWRGFPSSGALHAVGAGSGGAGAARFDEPGSADADVT